MAAGGDATGAANRRRCRVSTLRPRDTRGHIRRQGDHACSDTARRRAGVAGSIPAGTGMRGRPAGRISTRTPEAEADEATGGRASRLSVRSRGGDAREWRPSRRRKRVSGDRGSSCRRGVPATAGLRATSATVRICAVSVRRPRRARPVAGRPATGARTPVGRHGFIPLHDPGQSCRASPPQGQGGGEAQTAMHRQGGARRRGPITSHRRCAFGDRTEGALSAITPKVRLRRSHRRCAFCDHTEGALSAIAPKVRLRQSPKVRLRRSPEVRLRRPDPTGAGSP